MTSRSKEIGILGIVLLILTCVFYDLIALDPILARDDQNILSHLHGISDLFFLIKNGHMSEVIAYQPIRDLTYFFDLAIQKQLGPSTFHFTNFAIWIAIVLCVYSLLKNLYQDRILPLEMTVLFALHPIFVDSVGWISARKHLLSCLFILLATDLLIRFQKNGGRKWLAILGILILYCLSLLSQPINVLWPAWALTYCLCISKQERRPGLISIPLACAPALMIGAIANLYYYFYLYPIHTSTVRWANSAGEIGISFLALGRYFFNLLIPARLALIYYPGSVLNLAGLILLALFTIFLARKIEFRKWFPWFIFFAFPLFPVLVKPTNIFVSDTYILVGSFGVLNLIILFTGSIWKRSRIAYILILLSFLFLSHRQAKTWESDRALWMSSYAAEPAPRSLAFNAKYLIEEGRYAEATQEALLLQSWDPKQEDFPLLFAKSIYLNPEMSDGAKISLLESRKGTHAWIDYFLASLYAKQGRFLDAFDLMKSRLNVDNPFKDDLPTVSAETRYFCIKARDVSSNLDCDTLLSQARASKYWNEKQYLSRFNELTTH